MSTIKKISGFGAAFMLALTMGAAYAEDADRVRDRSQDRLHTEADLQAPDKDQSRDQLRIRENMTDDEMAAEQEKNRVRNEYRYRKNIQQPQNGADSASMSRQNRNR